MKIFVPKGNVHLGASFREGTLKIPGDKITWSVEVSHFLPWLPHMDTIGTFMPKCMNP